MCIYIYIYICIYICIYNNNNNNNNNNNLHVVSSREVGRTSRRCAGEGSAAQTRVVPRNSNSNSNTNSNSNSNSNMLKAETYRYIISCHIS